MMVTQNYSNINVRMDSEVKAQAESMFANLGLNMSTAVNMFIRQCLVQRKIPFAIAENAAVNPIENPAYLRYLSRISKDMEENGGEVHALLEVEDD